MSEGNTSMIGEMQQCSANSDSDDETPVRMKVVASTQASFSVKLTLAFVGVAAVIALLITVIAIAIGAASVQRASLLATPSTPPATSTSTPAPVKLDDSSNCGFGVWKRIAFLNMSDPAQQCPNGWRGYSTPIRSCGRPVTSQSTCAPVYFSTNGMQYSRVCGRLIGYQKGSPDGFGSIDFDKTLDGIYVDGVSMTHGNPRTHVWSFAVGLFTGENRHDNNCPCEGGRQQPAFVGGNFFCNSGDHDPGVSGTYFYQDPLWSGSNCPNATGCPFNSPPWFSTKLPRPTQDDIEVRICGDEGSGNEDSPIQLLEIYVQ